MMRVMTPKGVLREVKKAEPVCEVRFELNGVKRRFAETAGSMESEPTALRLILQDVKNVIFGMRECELFIGNLKPEKVLEIQRKLLAEGYYDFSGLGYQKVTVVDDTVFDKGVSAPYTSDYTAGTQLPMGCNQMCCQADIFPQMESCDDDDREGEDEQE